MNVLKEPDIMFQDTKVPGTFIQFIKKHVDYPSLDMGSTKTMIRFNSYFSSSLAELSQYKYVLYIEDQGDDDYLSMLMFSGACLFILKPKNPNRLWYHELLIPFDEAKNNFGEAHFIEINKEKELLSIEDWIQRHEKQCERIAKNLADFVSKILTPEIMLDYLEHSLRVINHNRSAINVVEDINLILFKDELGVENIEVPVEYVGILIGKKGANIQEIQNKTNTKITSSKIDVVKKSDGRSYQIFRIEGTISNIEKAKKLVMDVANLKEQIIAIPIDVNDKFFNDIDKIQKEQKVIIYKNLRPDEMKSYSGTIDRRSFRYYKIVGLETSIANVLVIIESLSDNQPRETAEVNWDDIMNLFETSIENTDDLVEQTFENPEKSIEEISETETIQSETVAEQAKVKIETQTMFFKQESKPTIQKRFSILIPYRSNPIQNREEQLKQIIPYLEEKLNAKNANFDIIVVEQSDDNRKFNRGALLNIGAKIATKNKSDYIIFHDVDLLPDDDLIDYYLTYPGKNTVIHIGKQITKYSYDEFLGAVASISVESNEKVNGYPNCFWGWGGEDDAYIRRLVLGLKKPQILQPTRGIYEELHLEWSDKAERIPKEVKHRLIDEDYYKWIKEGLKQVQYEVLNEESIGSKSIKYTVEIENECAEEETVENIQTVLIKKPVERINPINRNRFSVVIYEHYNKDADVEMEEEKFAKYVEDLQSVLRTTNNDFGYEWRIIIVKDETRIKGSRQNDYLYEVSEDGLSVYARPNTGLAYNIGLRKSKELGCEWVVFQNAGLMPSEEIVKEYFKGNENELLFLNNQCIVLRIEGNRNIVDGFNSVMLYPDNVINHFIKNYRGILKRKLTISEYTGQSFLSEWRERLQDKEVKRNIGKYQDFNYNIVIGGEGRIYRIEMIEDQILKMRVDNVEKVMPIMMDRIIEMKQDEIVEFMNDKLGDISVGKEGFIRKVLTFNMNWQVMSDMSSNKKQLEYLERVAKVDKPDYILLQEASYMDDFKLDGYLRSDWVINNNKNESRLVIFYKEGMIIRDEMGGNLSEYSLRPYQILVMADDVCVVNVHFPHGREGKEALEKIRELLKDISYDKLIIAGDFNMEIVDM